MRKTVTDSYSQEHFRLNNKNILFSSWAACSYGYDVESVLHFSHFMMLGNEVYEHVGSASIGQYITLYIASYGRP